jgi:3,4-dihydroxy 2-butanone 4-phosphate synthase/GTP cyclohydrolase II
MNTIEEGLAAFGAGKMIIVTDDENRENEGDLCIDARFATPEAVNFMARQACGLICVPMEKDRLDALGLAPMVACNTDNHGTAFTVSVDHVDTTTGISAFERAHPIRKLIDPSCGPADFRRPGHVFPLAGRKGGVLIRQGHTEAMLDLVRLARENRAFAGDPGEEARKPLAGVICEIINPDGTMARHDSLEAFARTHDLCMISIADLVRYRNEHDSPVTRETETRLPTKYGDFRLVAYSEHVTGKEHLALVLGDIPRDAPVLCRIHSECLTGDALGSRRCDCGEQYDEAMRRIAENGQGVLVYLRQEGRGIGLVNKMKAYALQDTGMDTVDANICLGFPADLRDYRVGAGILKDLGIRKVRVLTNNPAKTESLELCGIEVTERIPLLIEPNDHNKFYLRTKQERMNHLLDISVRQTTH